MPNVSRRLPARPHLDVPKREAQALLKAWKRREPEALERIQRFHPKFAHRDLATAANAVLKLSDAQWVVAHEYNFSNWAELKRRIAAHSIAEALRTAIHENNMVETKRILSAFPDLLHIPVRSKNWGPPLSHAANLGHLEIMEIAVRLGAKDFQHALDRALLQGKLEAARWLLARGAKFTRDLILGPCHTLNAAGFDFVVELAGIAQQADQKPLAPLAMVLETYSRAPSGKHAILERFHQLGYALSDSPMMAFHRGRLDLLQSHVQRDRTLLERRFSYRDIYPPELGCHDDGRSGLHGTPIAGSTLLHLAIEFDELEIMEWLLRAGADVNAHATLDADGCGDHTPLFNAMVSMPACCGRLWGKKVTQLLLDHGADRTVRVNLRKFIDWVAKPGWHEARDVDPVDWAETFPDQGWVNKEGLALLTK